MTIVEKLNDGIKDAMRNRDQIRLDTLRMMKSKVLTVDARGNLPDAEVIKLLKTYSGNLQEALEQAQAAQRSEMADKLKTELAIVHEFLPKALSREETQTIVKQAIVESGAKTKRDLGLVMKAIMKINNTVDGKLSKEIADQLLED
jgi:uncharacterized protein YqeY